jgi:cytochrome P450
MVTKVGGYIFSNGLHVPEGVNVCIPGYLIMRDNSIYLNTDEFGGFRHQMPYHLLGSDKVVPTISMSSTGPDFLTFGHGVHACLGRFLATIVLKVVMRHLLKSLILRLSGKEGRTRSGYGTIPQRQWGVSVGVRRRTT